MLKIRAKAALHCPNGPEVTSIAKSFVLMAANSIYLLRIQFGAAHVALLKVVGSAVDGSVRWRTYAVQQARQVRGTRTRTSPSISSTASSYCFFPTFAISYSQRSLQGAVMNSKSSLDSLSSFSIPLTLILIIASIPYHDHCIGFSPLT